MLKLSVIHFNNVVKVKTDKRAKTKEEVTVRKMIENRVSDKSLHTEIEKYFIFKENKAALKMKIR